MKRVFLTLLLFASMVSVATAQTELPEKDKDKAIFCFDVQFAKIRESKLTQSVGKEMVDKIFKKRGLPALSIETCDRISGLVGTPHDRKEAIAMLSGPNFPFNIFVEFQMVDAESAKACLAGVDKNSSQVIDNVEYFNIPERQNIICGITGKKNFVFGTKNYVLANSRKTLFSDRLNKAWTRRQANMPIRASLDVLSSADFFIEYVKIGARNHRGTTALLKGWINSLESLNFAVDLSGEELLFLRGIGKSPTATEELRSDLNDMQTLFKNTSTQTRKTTMVSEMLDEMSTSVAGREIDIVIGRPENLETIIKEWIAGEAIDR